eukprot:10748129-Lingulodinium_polyedra.AAC.1
MPRVPRGTVSRTLHTDIEYDALRCHALDMMQPCMLRGVLRDRVLCDMYDAMRLAHHFSNDAWRVE